MDLNRLLKKSVGILLVFSAVIASFSTIASEKFSSYVDEKGNISFPKEFRTSMAHLGSWYVPAGDASGFHDVYTEKESIVFFRKTGKFPDGATLVKELRASHSADYTTGNDVKHSTKNIKQWFVMIKDTNKRFSGNAIWGDGWGWALFKPSDQTKNLALDYKKDCLGCHAPAKEKDWVYTEAYPILKTK